MAADQQQTQAIKDIFRDKTRGRELFTSVDVHKQFGREKLRHVEIRDVLHSMWFSDEVPNLGYDRSLEPMDNGFDTFIYVPVGVDPALYTNRNQTLGHDSGPDRPIYAPAPTTTAAVNTPAPTTTNQPHSNVPSRYISRKSRADGAIEIPRPVLNMLGKFTTGDRLYGYFDQGAKEIVITSAKPPVTNVKSFFVYTGGCTRVPKSLVIEHMANSQRFRLSVNQGELRVKTV